VIIYSLIFSQHNSKANVFNTCYRRIKPASLRSSDKNAVEMHRLHSIINITIVVINNNRLTASELKSVSRILSQEATFLHLKKSRCSYDCRRKFTYALRSLCLSPYCATFYKHTQCQMYSVKSWQVPCRPICIN